MTALYNTVVIPLLRSAYQLLSLFNPKIRRGLEGRRGLGKELREHYAHVEGSRKRIWIHVASFGELEQARPVIERLRQEQPRSHIHLTFFSPSGYENAKDRYPTPDIITYSPLDDTRSVQEFLDAVRPDIALFAKYDVWPNAINALRKQNIFALLFSASIGPDSGRYFPVVRNFTRRVYSQLSKILTISEEDKEAFVRSGVPADKIEVAGDTRFDRVIERQATTLNTAHIPLEIIQKWKEEETFVFVAGSVWAADVKVMAPFLKKTVGRSDNIVWILIPHEPTERHLTEIESMINVRSVRLSQLGGEVNAGVIIADSIGKLFELYAVADAAFVGGGFSSGAHNVLEAAVWQKPVIVGPRHCKTKEIAKLIQAEGAFEVRTAEEFEFALWQLMKDQDLREITGKRARTFVEQGTGATERIMRELRPQLFS